MLPHLRDGGVVGCLATPGAATGGPPSETVHPDAAGGCAAHRDRRGDGAGPGTAAQPVGQSWASRGRLDPCLPADPLAGGGDSASRHRRSGAALLGRKCHDAAPGRLRRAPAARTRPARSGDRRTVSGLRHPRPLQLPGRVHGDAGAADPQLAIAGSAPSRQGSGDRFRGARRGGGAGDSDPRQRPRSCGGRRLLGRPVLSPQPSRPEATHAGAGGGMVPPGRPVGRGAGIRPGRRFGSGATGDLAGNPEAHRRATSAGIRPGLARSGLSTGLSSRVGVLPGPGVGRRPRTQRRSSTGRSRSASSGFSPERRCSSWS